MKGRRERGAEAEEDLEGKDGEKDGRDGFCQIPS